MKKILCILGLLGLLAACGKEPDPVVPATDVTGAWELSNVSTKASVGSVTVSVYVDFSSDGTFSLYQKIGDGRYSAFSGKWLLSDDDILSGTYEGGKSWGPYEASVSGSTLTLVSSGGSEVDTYRKIASIPDAVKENCY